MSYQILYDSKKPHIIRKTKKRNRIGLRVGIFSVALLGFLRFSGWSDDIWRYLIPGDPEVTTAAFQSFSDCLQNGQGFSDAVFAFCDTIIQGAAIG